MDAEKLYETLGLDISDVKKYKRMELHFQNYVLGNVVQMYKIHQRLSQGELRQDELYESYMKERAEGQLRIYKDFGEGYSEKNACSVYADPKQVCIDIKLEEGVSRIRIDVAHRPGILCFQNAIDGNGHSLRIEETNGVSWGDKTVLFTNEKPHIHFSISGESTVKIVYAYYCVGEDSVKSLIELIEKYHWLYEEKCRMNANQIEMAEKIEGLNARLSETMRQMIEAQGRAEHFAGAYSEISNSTIWRITYPIRKILDKLKGHR